MSLRHTNHVDEYEPLNMYLPSRLKQALVRYKHEEGVDMTTIVTKLLDGFFQGKIQITFNPPARINSYRGEQ